jgi:hypothetical protein
MSLPTFLGSGDEASIQSTTARKAALMAGRFGADKASNGCVTSTVISQVTSSIKCTSQHISWNKKCQKNVIQQQHDVCGRSLQKKMEKTTNQHTRISHFGIAGTR